ncbi:MAG: hypothetical protein GYA56_10920 [Geobacteraceae bacterium]|nr:hypothetical protein [Geobacteraceae bacterium]
MRNVERPKVTMSPEEIEKIENMDWRSYQEQSLMTDLEGMINCTKCKTILIARSGQSEISCYTCGESVKV